MKEVSPQGPIIPFVFRILDKKGTPIYTSKAFKEINYASDDKVLANARKGEIGRESTRAPGKDRPFRIVSSPLYSEGKLTRIIQMGTDLYLVRKSLSNFRENILAALPIILALGRPGRVVVCQAVSFSHRLHCIEDA